MRESLRVRAKDIFQRLAMVAIFFVVFYVGAFLGGEGRPDTLAILAGAFGASTLLWVLDPAFQHLYDTAEDEGVDHDGDVA